MRTDIVRKQVVDSMEAKQAIASDPVLMEKIASVADVCTAAYKAGGKTLWCGNGGSAADAQHMVGELVNKFYFDRPGLPAIALTTDPSVVTAIGNDYGFDDVFAHQVRAFGVPGDVFIGISTSGKSRNILAAQAACREKGVTTVAITGGAPCPMDSFDYVIKVPSLETPRIQECQTLIGHIICCIIEKEMFPEQDPENRL